MPEFPKFTGNCPKNVAKDAKYTVRLKEGKPVVALTYATSDDERWYMTTTDHPELVTMVNAVKVATSGKPNGSFYINEFNQVIVPSVGTPDYFLGGKYAQRLKFNFEGKVISGEPVNLEGTPLDPGTKWVGPRAGIPYTLAAGGNDIYFNSEPRPNVKKKVKLSKQIGPEAAANVAKLITDIKGFSGGRFYVNEFLSIFTPLQEGGELQYIYVGQLDLSNWFTPEIG